MRLCHRYNRMKESYAAIWAVLRALTPSGRLNLEEHLPPIEELERRLSEEEIADVFDMAQQLVLDHFDLDIRFQRVDDYSFDELLVLVPPLPC